MAQPALPKHTCTNKAKCMIICLWHKYNWYTSTSITKIITIRLFNSTYGYSAVFFKTLHNTQFHLQFCVILTHWLLSAGSILWKFSSHLWSTTIYMYSETSLTHYCYGVKHWTHGFSGFMDIFLIWISSLLLLRISVKLMKPIHMANIMSSVNIEQIICQI